MMFIGLASYLLFGSSCLVFSSGDPAAICSQRARDTLTLVDPVHCGPMAICRLSRAEKTEQEKQGLENSATVFCIRVNKKEGRKLHSGDVSFVGDIVLSLHDFGHT